MQIKPEQGGLVSNRVIEVIVGACIFGFGALLIYDAKRLGTGWASDGPMAGYFPFYIGVLLCAASAGAVVQALRAAERFGAFVEKLQFRMVLTMLVPTAAYLAAVGLIGIYIASAVFIGGFMAWQGKYRWPRCCVVAISVPVAMYLMFEAWFKVPLPKGPIEALIGLA